MAASETSPSRPDHHHHHHHCLEKKIKKICFVIIVVSGLMRVFKNIGIFKIIFLKLVLVVDSSSTYQD
jgi:hypothetical protein